MKFKHFNYPGNWWTRLAKYLEFRLRGIYLVYSLADVPYYKQYKKDGSLYTLASGTKCYCVEEQLLLELHKDCWRALGDSEKARSINNMVDYFSERTLSENDMLSEIRWIINEQNQGIADRIIQAELDKVGVKLEPFKES